jgi:hypothetical protein
MATEMALFAGLALIAAAIFLTNDGVSIAGRIRGEGPVQVSSAASGTGAWVIYANHKVGYCTVDTSTKVVGCGPPYGG